MEFNLGSANPPRVRELLRGLIESVGSRSIVVPTPAGTVKAVLGAMDRVGWPLMYREQYAIADVNCVVDISATQQVLGWSPQSSDSEMLIEAYREFQQAPDRTVTNFWA